MDLEVMSRLLDKLAPWAGGLLVVSICLRVMNEKPSDLLRALARLLWGK